MLFKKPLVRRRADFAIVATNLFANKFQSWWYNPGVPTPGPLKKTFIKIESFRVVSVVPFFTPKNPISTGFYLNRHCEFALGYAHLCQSNAIRCRGEPAAVYSPPVAQARPKPGAPLY